MQKYNGWSNYATWNVALWIGNDEGLYDLAKEAGSYRKFVRALTEHFVDTGECYKTPKRTLAEILAGPNPHKQIYLQTPDGVSWKDKTLNTRELTEMIKEL